MPTLIATGSSLHNVVRSTRRKSVHSLAHRKAALSHLELRPTHAGESSFDKPNSARSAVESNRSLVLYRPIHPLQPLHVYSFTEAVPASEADVLDGASSKVKVAWPRG